MIENINYQLGLLHFVHLLVSADGKIDDSEREAILAIKAEEKIPDTIFNDFQEKLTTSTEQEIYTKGIEYLTACSDEEFSYSKMIRPLLIVSVRHFEYKVAWKAFSE